mmetsp:Transcript_105587/g.281232  ORF Transcript_105587/g.281232 Transcript_105587/m.281232 type:complete len:265 (-) Transcript_105587:360-1154(-)
MLLRVFTEGCVGTEDSGHVMRRQTLGCVPRALSKDLQQRVPWLNAQVGERAQDAGDPVGWQAAEDDLAPLPDGSPQGLGGPSRQVGVGRDDVRDVGRSHAGGNLLGLPPQGGHQGFSRMTVKQRVGAQGTCHFVRAHALSHLHRPVIQCSQQLAAGLLPKPREGAQGPRHIHGSHVRHAPLCSQPKPVQQGRSRLLVECRIRVEDGGNIVRLQSVGHLSSSPCQRDQELGAGRPVQNRICVEGAGQVLRGHLRRDLPGALAQGC